MPSPKSQGSDERSMTPVSSCLHHWYCAAGIRTHNINPTAKVDALTTELSRWYTSLMISINTYAFIFDF